MAAKDAKVAYVADRIYGVGYFLCRGEGAAVERKLRRLNADVAQKLNAEDFFDSDAYGRCSPIFRAKSGNKGMALWLSDGLTAKVAALVAAHEAFHATANVMREVGLDLCDETEEAYAYYQMWLMGEMMEKLK